MTKHVKLPKTCQICGAPADKAELVAAATVGHSVARHIRSAFPAWSSKGFICRKDLNDFRTRYFQSLLADEKGGMSELNAVVLESLRTHKILSLQGDGVERPLKFGERLADRVAAFGGSWTFIMLFAGVLVAWMAVNSAALMTHPFDPYPYIFLNLILSCIAAVQAPVIMMSQNRNDARDRLRAQNDYQVNLKAELEIRHLHDKLDHLISVQWERLIEIQDIQLEMMNELVKKSAADSPKAAPAKRGSRPAA